MVTGARLWRCGVRNFGAAGFQLARETCDDHDPLTAAVSAPGCAFHPVELKAAIELPLAPRASAEPESLLGWVVKGNATPGATHVFRLRYTLPNAVHGLAASPYARLRLRYGNFDIVWNHFLPFFLLCFDQPDANFTNFKFGAGAMPVCYRGDTQPRHVKRRSSLRAHPPQVPGAVLYGVPVPVSAADWCARLQSDAVPDSRLLTVL